MALSLLAGWLLLAAACQSTPPPKAEPAETTVAPGLNSSPGSAVSALPTVGITVVSPLSNGTEAAPSALPMTSVAVPTGPATSTEVNPAPDSGPTASPPTSTDDAEAERVRFAVIGDFGLAGPPAQAVAELVHSWQPDFIVTTGDNNYPNGEMSTIDDNIGQYYAAYIAPYKGRYGQGGESNRFFPSPGNHDWNVAGLAPYLEYFSLPGNERYYEFMRGPVHLFSLDSDSREPDGINRGSVQAAWLLERLAASTAPWKIVAMHHPAYSSGHHGSIAWMQWPFAEWGASAVLAGHDHLYERLQIDGLPYFTNGLGGYPAIYAFQEPLEGSQVRYRADYGAMLVEADSDEITFQFINLAGEVVDTLTLTG